MFGQVPALVVGDVILTQSNAILRYVAKLKPESDLYPSDPITAARVDAICDQEADAFVGCRVAKYKDRFGIAFLSDAANEPLLDSTWAALNSEVVPRHLASLTALLNASPTGWLAGTPAPSIADFVWATGSKEYKGDKTVR